MESKNIFDIVTTNAMIEAMNFCSKQHNYNLEGYKSIPQFIEEISIVNPKDCYSLLQTFKKSLVKAMAYYINLYEDIIDKNTKSHLEQFCAWMITIIVNKQNEIKKVTVH